VTGAGVTSPYQVFVPLNYDPSKKWRVILFLHSSTERGTDNLKQLTLGLGPVVMGQEATWQAITIFPQVGLNESARGAYIRIGMAALDAVTANYNVDPARIYVTGISAGGVYGFEMLHLNPTRFAAFMPMAANTCPVCITGNAASTQADAALQLAREMPTMGYWQFQGTNDGSIPVQDARDITAAWKTVNPAAKYSEYPGVGHGQTHLSAYAEPTIFTWLFAQHR
jgi:predicted peptidase